jgi:hypothetical protein
MSIILTIGQNQFPILRVGNNFDGILVIRSNVDTPGEEPVVVTPGEETVVVTPGEETVVGTPGEETVVVEDVG